MQGEEHMQLQVTGHITGIEARNGGWFAVAITEQGAAYPKKLSTKKPDLVQAAQQMMGQYVDALYNESESTNINPNNGQPYMNRYLEALAMAGQGLPQAPQQSFQQQPQQQYAPQVPVQPAPYGQPAQPQPIPQQYQPQPVQQNVNPIQQAQAQYANGVVTPQQKEERIMREAAAKVAVELLDHLDPADRTLASVVRISEQLVGYFRDGVQWSVPPVQQAQQSVQPQQGVGPAMPQGQGAQDAYEQAGGYEQPQGGFPAHDVDDDIPFAPAIH
jgi:hypothetical protein